MAISIEKFDSIYIYNVLIQNLMEKYNMETNMELIKQIILAIDKKHDRTTIFTEDSLEIEHYSNYDVFFHTEILFKAGYLNFFQYTETSDYRSTFLVGGFTIKGNDLVDLIENTDTWDKVKNEIKENELPYILEQNFRFYFPAFIDGALWRYMSIDKLESLLSTNSLYFCRADLLGDEHEGSNPIPTIQNRPNFYEGATKHYIEKGIPEMQKALRQCTYISCWHFNTNESAAMWKSYGKGKKSIAIQTTISKVEESILNVDKQFALGPIHYIDYSKDYISEANSFIPFFYKQKGYESEREFRIITDNLKIINDMFKKKAIPPKGLFIDINIQILIQHIIISPFSSRKFRNEVFELLNKYNRADRLKESTISRSPNF
jgi:hypothetical protein